MLSCTMWHEVEGRAKLLSVRTGLFQNIVMVEGARGVIVIVVGNGHGDSSSNPGRDWLHFT